MRIRSMITAVLTASFLLFVTAVQATCNSSYMTITANSTTSLVIAPNNSPSITYTITNHFLPMTFSQAAVQQTGIESIATAQIAPNSSCLSGTLSSGKTCQLTLILTPISDASGSNTLQPAIFATPTDKASVCSLAISSVPVTVTKNHLWKTLSIALASGDKEEAPLGYTTQYVATATNLDVSNDPDATSLVTWNSSAPAVASIVTGGNNAGQVTALTLGPTTISATGTGADGKPLSSNTMTFNATAAVLAGVSL